MTKPSPLTHDQLATALAQLSDWAIIDGKLHKLFKFKNFSQALGWMVQVGLEAEKLDHHPDWCNSWNKVQVHLITHSIGSLSERDILLAQKMDELAK